MLNSRKKFLPKRSFVLTQNGENNFFEIFVDFYTNNLLLYKRR